MTEAELFLFALRTNFKAFVQYVFGVLNPGQEFEDNWHIDYLCWWAMEIMAGRKNRSAIVAAPRTLKSLLFSVALPTFMLGHNPGARFFCVSHNGPVADQFNSDRRKVIMSKRFMEAFPPTRLSPTKNTESFFETTAGGSCRAATPGRGVTGLGADVLLVDDIVNAGDANNIALHQERVDWLQTSFFTRTNRPNDAIHIIIGQRLNYYDPIGALLATGEYESAVIPAIAQKDEIYEYGDVRAERPAGNILHERMLSEQELARRRVAMGSLAFKAQYLLDPEPEGGGALKWSWFKIYDQRPRNMYIFQSWDTARTPNGGDYTVCMTIGYRNEQYFILDVYRQQLDFEQVVNVMRHKIRSEKPHGVIIDASDGAGYGIYRTLVASGGFDNIVPFESNKSKEDRIYSITPILEGGDVFIPKGAAFILAFRAEYITFPSRSEHDDQLDALSQFLINVRGLVRGAGGDMPRKYLNMPQFRASGF
jgi:predicted phage terminase large subunit-like protein